MGTQSSNNNIKFSRDVKYSVFEYIHAAIYFITYGLVKYIPPPIGDTRRYQTLQALTNCTRRSLLPDPNIDEAARQGWQEEIKALEAKGIR